MLDMPTHVLNMKIQPKAKTKDPKEEQRRGSGGQKSNHPSGSTNKWGGSSEQRLNHLKSSRDEGKECGVESRKAKAREREVRDSHGASQADIQKSPGSAKSMKNVKRNFPEITFQSMFFESAQK